jgi:hypothetical protein
MCLKLVGKGGIERRRVQKVLEPWVFDRRKPISEEIARMKTLTDNDRLKWCDDFVRKVLEPTYIKWIRYGVVYKALMFGDD